MTPISGPITWRASCGSVIARGGATSPPNTRSPFGASKISVGRRPHTTAPPVPAIGQSTTPLARGHIRGVSDGGFLVTPRKRHGRCPGDISANMGRPGSLRSCTAKASTPGESNLGMRRSGAISYRSSSRI
jgi:hypothetical protein